MTLDFLLIFYRHFVNIINFITLLGWRILVVIVGGLGVVALSLWTFQRRKVEELVKLDDLLAKLQKRRERLKERATLSSQQSRSL